MAAHERQSGRLRLIYLLAAVILAVLVPGVAQALKRSFIPIPEIVTDPNEGNTFGFLPVILFLDDRGQIRYMLAPDVTFNEIKGFFPTFRFFGYPSATRRYSLLAGKSSTVDEDYEAEFTDTGLWEGRAFLHAFAMHEKDSTERFFGLGNRSPESGESNYTSVDTTGEVELGYWLLSRVHVGWRTRVRRFTVRRGQVDGFPFIAAAHPRTPGLGGATIWGNLLALTYDSRDLPDIPHRGALAVLYGEVADRRLGSTTSFVKYGAELRKFIPFRRARENPVLALHALLDYVSGARDTPFFERSRLGGRRTLRGFGSDRFTDNNRLLGTAELRTTVYRRRIFGVRAALELAPFLEAGRVFRRGATVPLSGLHYVAGIGFRGVVRPQVVGFVDFGRGSEGPVVFTGISYPF